MSSYTELNVNLVEAFGDLERLCSQIYNEQHGVSRYIDVMKNSYGGNRTIQNWETDLKMLITVRDKRNKLSHNEVSFSIPWATQEDINFITGFRSRILSGSDPLAMLRRTNEAKIQPRPTQTANTTVRSRSPRGIYQPLNTHYQRPQPRHAGCGLCISLFTLAAIVVFFFFT